MRLNSMEFYGLMGICCVVNQGVACCGSSSLITCT